jgi:hypothetical protein
VGDEKIKAFKDFFQKEKETLLFSKESLFPVLFFKISPLPEGHRGKFCS